MNKRNLFNKFFASNKLSKSNYCYRKILVPSGTLVYEVKQAFSKKKKERKKRNLNYVN